MTPLSAIGQMLLPAGTLPASPAAMGATGAGMIPPAELQPISLPDGLPPVSAPPPVGGADSFSSVLGRMVGEVNARQTLAGEAVQGLQSGQNVPLHQAIIAMEEANVSFQLMVEVRNKLLDSYQELMRMQI